ncbi:flagellin [Flexibacterium corallicola]|uniref:flagellin n=1 Tax=Flexibacterium corallicola TaxID=3037259 RepID=UPI00286F6003|nr:flagellin [Pseudovibrio sp. M1P-2-3]
MTYYSISTISMTNRMNGYITSETKKLNDALVETGTQRHADMGLELGGQYGTTISLRNEFNYLNQLQTANGQTDVQLSVADAAMEISRTTAESLRDDLIGLRDTTDTVSTQAGPAMESLSFLLGQLNTTTAGVSVFGGTEVGSPPMNEFNSNNPATNYELAAKDILNDYLISVGLVDASGDPDETLMTAADMEDFASNVFPTAFSDLWNNGGTINGNTYDPISSATDDTIDSTIGDFMPAQGSVSANEQAFIDMATGYVLVGVFGAMDLGEEAQKELVNQSVTKLSAGIDGTVEVQSTVGVVRDRIEKSDERIQVEMNALNQRVIDLENVDPNQVAVELSQAEAQLEINYAVTSRIKNLSLLNYL